MPKLSAEVSIGSILQILTLVATVALGYGTFRSEFASLRMANEHLTVQVDALNARLQGMQLQLERLKTQVEMQSRGQ